MKTAVEWYNAKLNAIDFKLNSGLINYEQCKVEMAEAFEQAKQMEKEQVTLSHINGQSEFDKGAYGEHNQKLANEYYKQTFKKK